MDMLDKTLLHLKRSNKHQFMPKTRIGQTDINKKMRLILLDWMLEVSFKFETPMRIYELAINYVDRPGIWQWGHALLRE